MASTHELTEWHRVIAGKPLVFCKKCGVIKRETNKPCRGPVRVGPRAKTEAR